MKSLNDQYTATHSSTHETFADLVFCALIVLVLFVMTLAVEVSQRVRAELTEPEPVAVVNEEQLSEMTVEEVAELSRTLQQQREQLKSLQAQLHQRNKEIASQANEVADKLAAIQGEQRFTGAREEAAISLAYDYSSERYYFVPSRDIEHADRRQSGESALDYLGRKSKELAAIALAAREQRGFTLEETQSIYKGFSKYQEIRPTANSYRVEMTEVNTYYHIMLCGYIAGNTDVGDALRSVIELKLLAACEPTGPDSDSMYPKCTLIVHPERRRISLNGVEMSPRSMKEILLSFSGRGAMLDLEGFEGKPPEWLKEEVLTPAGYIGKVPKTPE